MKCYLDMDGVLTAFETTVKALGPEAAKGLSEDATEVQKQVMYKAIEDAGIKFWSSMPWKTDGKQLWMMLQKFRPTLLTSPGKFTYAENGKLLWVKRNIPGTSIYFSNCKSEYVDPFDISVLIDDMKNNIEAWKEQGGIGILYTSLEDTERKLLELLWKA
jgi:hypothetical protein